MTQNVHRQNTAKHNGNTPGTQHNTKFTGTQLFRAQVKHSDPCERQIEIDGV